MKMSLPQKRQEASSHLDSKLSEPIEFKSDLIFGVEVYLPMKDGMLLPGVYNKSGKEPILGISGDLCAVYYDNRGKVHILPFPANPEMIIADRYLRARFEEARDRVPKGVPGRATLDYLAREYAQTVQLVPIQFDPYKKSRFKKAKY